MGELLQSAPGLSRLVSPQLTWLCPNPSLYLALEGAYINPKPNRPVLLLSALEILSGRFIRHTFPPTVDLHLSAFSFLEPISSLLYIFRTFRH